MRIEAILPELRSGKCKYTLPTWPKGQYIYMWPAFFDIKIRYPGKQDDSFDRHKSFMSDLLDEDWELYDENNNSDLTFKEIFPEFLNGKTIENRDGVELKNYYKKYKDPLIDSLVAIGAFENSTKMQDETREWFVRDESW